MKEKNKIKEETEKLKNDLKVIRDQNLEKMRNDRKNISLTIKGNRSIDYATLTEEEKKNLKTENIQKSIDKFWKKNRTLLESSSPEPEINEKKKKKIEERNKLVLTEKFLAIKKKEQNIKDKINFSEKIRNEYLLSNPDEKMDKSMNKNNNITELPKIPLFNQNEKKVLLNILPEKEIKKYEKRYEFIAKEKNNLLRKYNLETKQLQKEKEDLNHKCIFSSDQLNENEKKNQQLENKIKIQEKKLEELNNQLNEMRKNLNNKKNEVKLKDEENKELLKKLQRLQKNNGLDDEEGEKKEGKAKGEIENEAEGEEEEDDGVEGEDDGGEGEEYGGEGEGEAEGEWDGEEGDNEEGN